MARVTAEAEHKEALLRVRLQQSEKAKLVEQADFAGISVSELVRQRAANKSVFARTDLAMLRELRRCAGLLKHFHNLTGGTHAAQTAQVLSDLRATIRGLYLDHQKD